jgi:hypothetical protein
MGRKVHRKIIIQEMNVKFDGIVRNLKFFNGFDGFL